MQFDRPFGDEREIRVKPSGSDFSRHDEEEDEDEEEEENTELHEDDVWGMSSANGGRTNSHYTSQQESSHVRRGERSNSQPMDVPEWKKKRGGHSCNDDSDDDEENSNEIVPPHLMVAREHALRDMASFSVVEGHGRTLKGIDQRNVRNAVWRSTGFLD